MRDWMDFNRDGEVDSTERFFADEMLCGSREEHEALFGDTVGKGIGVIAPEEDNQLILQREGVFLVREDTFFLQFTQFIR